MAVNEYQQQVKVLSDQLLELQRPIRILDAIKWPSEVEKTFFKDKGR